MSAIVVACDRWLGLGSKYVVRVDGQVVGRLGRRSKIVHTDVGAGSHSVLVQYGGNETPAVRVDVSEVDEVRFTLEFASVVALVVKRALMPWKRRAAPIGMTLPGFMTLNRSS